MKFRKLFKNTYFTRIIVFVLMASILLSGCTNLVTGKLPDKEIDFTKVDEESGLNELDLDESNRIRVRINYADGADYDSNRYSATYFDAFYVAPDLSNDLSDVSYFQLLDTFENDYGTGRKHTTFTYVYRTKKYTNNQERSEEENYVTVSSNAHFVMYPEVKEEEKIEVDDADYIVLATYSFDIGKSSYHEIARIKSTGNESAGAKEEGKDYCVAKNSFTKKSEDKYDVLYYTILDNTCLYIFKTENVRAFVNDRNKLVLSENCTKVAANVATDINSFTSNLDSINGTNKAGFMRKLDFSSEFAKFTNRKDNQVLVNKDFNGKWNLDVYDYSVYANNSITNVFFDITVTSENYSDASEDEEEKINVIDENGNPIGLDEEGQEDEEMSDEEIEAEQKANKKWAYDFVGNIAISKLNDIDMNVFYYMNPEKPDELTYIVDATGDFESVSSDSLDTVIPKDSFGDYHYLVQRDSMKPALDLIGDENTEGLLRYQASKTETDKIFFTKRVAIPEFEREIKRNDLYGKVTDEVVYGTYYDVVRRGNTGGNTGLEFGGVYSGINFGLSDYELTEVYSDNLMYFLGDFQSNYDKRNYNAKGAYAYSGKEYDLVSKEYIAAPSNYDPKKNNRGSATLVNSYIKGDLSIATPIDIIKQNAATPDNDISVIKAKSDSILRQLEDYYKGDFSWSAFFMSWFDTIDVYYNAIENLQLKMYNSELHAMTLNHAVRGNAAKFIYDDKLMLYKAGSDVAFYPAFSSRGNYTGSLLANEKLENSLPKAKNYYSVKTNDAGEITNPVGAFQEVEPTIIDNQEYLIYVYDNRVIVRTPDTIDLDLDNSANSKIYEGHNFADLYISEFLVNKDYKVEEGIELDTNSSASAGNSSHYDENGNLVIDLDTTISVDNISYYDADGNQVTNKKIIDSINQSASDDAIKNIGKDGVTNSAGATVTFHFVSDEEIGYDNFKNTKIDQGITALYGVDKVVYVDSDSKEIFSMTYDEALAILGGTESIESVCKDEAIVACWDDKTKLAVKTKASGSADIAKSMKESLLEDGLAYRYVVELLPGDQGEATCNVYDVQSGRYKKIYTISYKQVEELENLSESQIQPIDVKTWNSIVNFVRSKSVTKKKTIVDNIGDAVNLGEYYKAKYISRFQGKFEDKVVNNEVVDSDYIVSSTPDYGLGLYNIDTEEYFVPTFQRHEIYNITTHVEEKNGKEVRYYDLSEKKDEIRALSNMACYGIYDNIITKDCADYPYFFMGYDRDDMTYTDSEMLRAKMVPFGVAVASDEVLTEDYKGNKTFKYYRDFQPIEGENVVYYLRDAYFYPNGNRIIDKSAFDGDYTDDEEEEDPQHGDNTPAPTKTPGGDNSPKPTNTPGGGDGDNTPKPTNTPGGGDNTPKPTNTPGGGDGDNTPKPTNTPGGGDGDNTPKPTNTPGGGDGDNTPNPTKSPGGGDNTPKPTNTPGGGDGDNTPNPTNTPGGGDGDNTPKPTNTPGGGDGDNTPKPTKSPGGGDGDNTPKPTKSPDGGDGDNTPKPTKSPGGGDGDNTPKPTKSPDSDGDKSPKPTKSPGGRDDGNKTPKPTNKPGGTDDDNGGGKKNYGYDGYGGAGDAGFTGVVIGDSASTNKIISIFDQDYNPYEIQEDTDESISDDKIPQNSVSQNVVSENQVSDNDVEAGDGNLADRPDDNGKGFPWWLILLILIVLLIVAYIIYRKRRGEPIIPEKVKEFFSTRFSRRQ